MKQLDTDTVLTIIEMIETGYENLENHLHDKDTNENEDYLKGAMHQLFYLKEHLQSLIEGELNAAELNTGE